MDNNIGGAERAGKDVKFERIRRITGYLVGTVDRWNCLLYTSRCV